MHDVPVPCTAWPALCTNLCMHGAEPIAAPDAFQLREVPTAWPDERGAEMRTNKDGRGRFGASAAVGLAIVGGLVTGLALLPSGAAGEEPGPAHAGVLGHSMHGREPVAGAMQAQLARVRAATAAFHRVSAAKEAGYELGWVNGAGARIVTGCVSHPTAGAMGYHYFNAALMADNSVDAREPEVLVYAPTPSGGLELVAVEWVVRSAQSNPAGVSTPPSVLGMDMHILVPPPGPAFYLTHAWVWADNPAGMFSDWNPDISCS